MSLETLTLNPTGPTTGAVVWLHGLGASCTDFVSLLPWVKRPGVRFVFPQAPDRPVSINGGAVMPAWYDITTLSESSDREDLDDVAVSATALTSILDDLRAEGIASERITLVGFSQGAAMSLWVGHRYPHRLKAILVMSGYLLAPDRHAAEGHAANAATPTFHMHGTRDEVVPVHRGEAAYRVMDDGRPTRWETYRMRHELCRDQAGDLKAWFEDAYAGPIL